VTADPVCPLRPRVAGRQREGSPWHTTTCHCPTTPSRATVPSRLRSRRRRGAGRDQHGPRQGARAGGVAGLPRQEVHAVQPTGSPAGARRGPARAGRPRRRRVRLGRAGGERPRRPAHVARGARAGAGADGRRRRCRARVLLHLRQLAVGEERHARGRGSAREAAGRAPVAQVGDLRADPVRRRAGVGAAALGRRPAPVASAGGGRRPRPLRGGAGRQGHAPRDAHRLRDLREHRRGRRGVPRVASP
jgi:hypothetical protein